VGICSQFEDCASFIFIHTNTCVGSTLQKTPVTSTDNPVRITTFPTAPTLLTDNTSKLPPALGVILPKTTELVSPTIVFIEAVPVIETLSTWPVEDTPVTSALWNTAVATFPTSDAPSTPLTDTCSFSFT